jgi:hypothetical protein
MRRRRWIRRIGAFFGTVALGAVLGFLVPTIVAEYTPKPAAAPAPATSMQNTSPELPIAREFINAFVVNDQAKLHELGADETDTVKANDLATQVAQIGKPVLLGSVGGPGISLQAYASDAVLRDGTATILSWRVLTISGRATLILPPDALSPNP